MAPSGHDRSCQQVHRDRQQHVAIETVPAVVDDVLYLPVAPEPIGQPGGDAQYDQQVLPQRQQHQRRGRDAQCANHDFSSDCVSASAPCSGGLRSGHRAYSPWRSVASAKTSGITP